MKVVNLFTFVFTLALAALGVWLVFVHFPWLNVPKGDHVMKVMTEVANANLDYRFQNASWWVHDGALGKGLDRYNFIEHAVAYTLSVSVGMYIVWWSEGKIFPIKADTNWKMVFPFYISPLLLLGTPLADNSDHWYELLLYASWLSVSCVWMYSFLYHAFRKARGPKKQTPSVTVR